MFGWSPGPQGAGRTGIGGFTVTEKAALFREDSDESIVASIEHCENCGYEVYGIVDCWDAAFDLFLAGLVQVVVVGRREVWAPRIEYADRNQRTIPTATTGGTANSRWRRARVVRRY